MEKTTEQTKGRMYQMVDGEVTEVIRHGEQLLPKGDRRLTQIIGQLTLALGIDY